MLSIGVVGQGQANYYVGLAREDYYLEGGEPPGRWIGKGAEMLGLTRGGDARQIQRAEFLSLFSGVDNKGRPLVKNAGDSERRPGWDLTFSAPKSVSVVWAMADPELKRAIEKAHFNAVKVAISYLEKGATTRRGAQGKIKEPANLVVATFEHGTSRAQQPQLHTHALLLNVAVRADGTTGTLVSQHFYDYKMAAGALYQAAFSHEIERIGFEIERQKVAYEIKGVPKALMEEFSKRRAEVEAALEKMESQSAAAAAFATLSTRHEKEHRPRNELFAEWESICSEFGFTKEQISELFAQSHSRYENHNLGAAVVASFAARATEQLTKTESHFSEADLMRVTAHSVIGWRVPPEVIEEGVKKFLAESPDLIKLEEQKGLMRYTTKEVWELEKGLLRASKDLKQKGDHLVSKNSYLYGILKAEQIAAERWKREGKTELAPQLTVEQREALTHIVSKPQDMAIVSGIAGSGKTFMLEAARHAWEHAGYKVIGTSVQGKTARGLEAETGIRSSTLMRLLLEQKRGFGPEVSTVQRLKTDLLYLTWNISEKTRLKMLGQYHKPTSKFNHAFKQATWQISKQQQKYLNWQLERKQRYEINDKTIVVLEEAGGVGTKQLAALVASVQAFGAKIVLSGDTRQTQPIEMGAPMRSLERDMWLGKAELTQILRQKEEWQRQAVADFATGETHKALNEFDKRGFFTVADNHDQAKTALINSWAKDGIKSSEKNLIFAGTQADIKDLNQMAKEERKRAGVLGIRCVKVGRAIFHEKDRVMFLKNDGRIGVENGDVGTIKSINSIRKTMRVTLDDGRKVTIPYTKYQDITLGYAMTTHKGQGVTVKNSYVLCGGSMTDRELTYVQVSRAKEKTELFAGRITLWNPLTRKHDDATVSEIARKMNRSRQKDMAHDVISETVRSHQVAEEKTTQERPPRYHTR